MNAGFIDYILNRSLGKYKMPVQELYSEIKIPYFSLTHSFPFSLSIPMKQKQLILCLLSGKLQEMSCSSSRGYAELFTSQSQWIGVFGQL